MLFLILIFIKIEEIIESIKIIINTFSPIKEFIIASKAKTIIIFCIEVLIEVSYTFSKLSFNTFIAPNYKLSFISGNKSYKLYPSKLSK